MTNLSNLRVAVIATDGFEEAELTQPVAFLKENGAQVEILSTKKGQIQGFRHHEKGQMIDVDRLIDEVKPESYDALVLPGGALNADALRMEPAVISFLQEIQRTRKPIAAICHAPWELISADLVRDRKLTAYYTIQDDIRNAGGEWVDQEVVVDDNWVTSRKPDDIPAFNREMLTVFSRYVPTTNTAQK